MRLRKHFEEQAQKRSTHRVREKAPTSSIANHRTFVPVITAWGAALLGLAVLVLPASMIARLGTLSGLSALGGATKFIFAAIAALLGAGLAYIVAAALRERVGRNEERVAVVSAVSSRRMRPIDPVVELGSDSLDAPLENIPFGAEEEDGEFEELLEEATERASASDQPTLGELSQRGYDIEEPKDCSAAEEERAEKPSFTRSQFKSALIETCEGATCEAAPSLTPMTAKAEPAAEDAPVQGSQPPSPEQQAPTGSAATPLATKKPIGSAQSNGSWSLTQYQPVPKPESDPAPVPAPVPASEPEKPRALDLGQFAELPGRNGVWVEEEAAPPTPTPAMKSVPNQVPPASALEKLRQKPTEELSIVEMVERFAGALHDHQRAQQKADRSGRMPQSGPGRDAALAEALKALTLFTERGFDQAPTAPEAANSNADLSHLGQTERELRDALVKLQNLRGAA